MKILWSLAKQHHEKLVPPRTDIPSNIVTPSVGTKSGRIIGKPKR